MKTPTLKRLFERNLRSRSDTLFDYARSHKLYSASVVELWFRTFIDQNPLEPSRDKKLVASLST